MIANSSTNDPRVESVDALDRLLATYFKAQLPQPWPPAPHVPITEPSSLVAERSDATAPSRSSKTVRDTNARARHTLAASVVLFFGACWYLSSGFQSSNRADSLTAPGGVLNDAEASKPAALMELKHDRVTKGEKAPPRQPMQLP
jgi:hypothetical protein